MKTKSTQRKAGAGATSVDAIVDELTMIVHDPHASADEREKASRMLASIEEKEKLNERMGLPTRRSRVHRQGAAVVFPAMTQEEARAHLAKKSARRTS